MSFTSSYSGLLMRGYRWLWLGRVAREGPDLPAGCLVLAGHYNGAVDGMTYGSQLPPALGVVSIQWHRQAIGRWLLPGIAVTRGKDHGSPAGNLGAFRQIGAALRAGDRLLFFPEGTSRLGEERLPVAKGTLLLLRLVRSPCPPPVYFASAHYHTPTDFRSDVAVVWQGPFALPAEDEALESFVAAGILEAQKAAYAMPAPRSGEWTPVAAVLAAPYLPIWWLVRRAARRVADEPNVIALWSFLFGVPATALWLVVLTVAAWCLGIPASLPLVSLVLGGYLWNK